MQGGEIGGAAAGALRQHGPAGGLVGGDEGPEEQVGGRPRREAEQRTVALRRLGGDAQEVLGLDDAVARLAAEATAPDLRNGPAPR